ncbi:hypothetical protein S245_048633, partial [Arachis hypogaea]
MNHHSNEDDYVCEIAETIMVNILDLIEKKKIRQTVDILHSMACQSRNINWAQSTTKIAPPTPTAL